jgi:hypothetical protein
MAALPGAAVLFVLAASRTICVSNAKKVRHSGGTVE